MEKELTCSNYELIMELSKEENNYYYENSNDQNDLFESTLTSMLSSPTTPSNGCGDKMMIKELIGRLGSISDSAFEINNNSNSNTPINSPPLSKFNLSSLMINNNYPINNLGYFNKSDPGFVEGAAKFSCFSNNNNNNININNLNLSSGKLSRVNSEKKIISNNNINNNGDSREGSSVSEQNPGVELGIKSQNDSNSRKRKSISKAKIKGSIISSIKDDNKVGVENKESDAKKSKVENELNKKENDGECNSSKEEEANDNKSNREVLNVVEAEKMEPPKDYIHVRARRGQATDSHSLAERVRREKISERMKFLQDLVPGCNKVTGKATVLDEIINYVQSLQRQVEFLSMKLSTVNSAAEFNTEALLTKDMFQSKGSSFPQTMYSSLDQNPAQEFSFAYQSTQQMQLAYLNGIENPFLVNHMNPTGIPQNANVPLPSSIDGFVDSLTQLPTLWEDDLQSIVQMGIVPNQTQSVPSATLPNSHMKVEL